MNTARLIAYLADHGVHAHINGSTPGTLRVLSEFHFAPSEWETIDADFTSVRNYLGY